MKSIYFIASFMLVSFSYAQYSVDGPLTSQPTLKPSKSEFPQRDINVDYGSSRVIIVSETFDDPFNNGWWRGGTGSSGSTYTASDCWKYDTIGPVGYYSSTFEKINSTTVADGFVILDADSLNVVNSQSTPEKFHAELHSPVYDLSGYSDVSLTFEHCFRLCCSTARNLFVEVSTDNFNNVSQIDTISYPYIPSTAPSGTITHFINITNAISGNPANVQIRFRFGTAGSSDNPSHYYWQIDDLTIFETIDYHGVLDSVEYYMNNFSFSPLQPGGFQKIPSYAAAVTTQGVSGYLRNIGSMDWTNAVVQLEENGIGIVTSSPQNVASGDLSQIYQISTPLPTTIGLYNYTIYGEHNPAFTVMDTGYYQFEVTPNLHSVAGSVPNGTASIDDWNWNTTPTSGGLGGSLITTADTNEIITGMRIRLRDTSYNANQTIEALVFVNDTLRTNGEIFTTDAAFFGGYQDLVFNNPVQISPNDVIEYYIISDFMPGGNHSVDFYTSGFAVHLGLAITFDNTGQPLANFITTPAMIDLVTSQGFLGLGEQNISSIAKLGQNRPNPFDNLSTIDFTLISNERIEFTITDVTGKTVKNINLGLVSKGEHQIQLNAADFNKGIYFYTLKAGDSRLTKKMIVTK